MRRILLAVGLAAAVVISLAPPSVGRDRPYGTSNMFLKKFAPYLNELENDDPQSSSGMTKDGKFSKTQIERFRCSSAGNPAEWVDISCNTTQYGQDWAPDNELAVAVDPEDSSHLLAGSNDYYYRFNNSTGARQAIVPTGFFTSFDGGKTWIDGQIPMQSGNGAGDPAPAFDGKHDVALMAQLENVGGQGGFYVSQGDVSVSRSTDGGRNWSEPVTVMKGTGTGIGPANQAVFWDKEWLTVDNYPNSPFYGRAYVTSTKFVNGLHGSYARSPIYLSWSDDGGQTWTRPKEISGTDESCTSQSTGPSGECDEDQFSIPEVASNGTLYVHFANSQNEAAWEAPEEFDTQIMVVKSTNGGESFSSPEAAVQLEDGASDMPWSVIGRQTIWGHQIRWTAIGNISVNPNDPRDVTIVFADRGTPNPFVLGPEGHPECVDEEPEAPDYDPCHAGPTSETNVYAVRSTNGGRGWSDRILVDNGEGAQQWFPWADHLSDGSLAVAWDEDTQPAPADLFEHVLVTGSIGGGTFTRATKEALGPREHPDVSATHWSGQYVPEDDWPTICGPNGSPTAGKDCNVFHGDYTGLAVGRNDSINVVWTGFNRFETTPQIDFYTGERHKGYAQDAMFARRRY